MPTGRLAHGDRRRREGTRDKKRKQCTSQQSVKQRIRAEAAERFRLSRKARRTINRAAERESTAIAAVGGSGIATSAEVEARRKEQLQDVGQGVETRLSAWRLKRAREEAGLPPLSSKSPKQARDHRDSLGGSRSLGKFDGLSPADYGLARWPEVFSAPTRRYMPCEVRPRALDDIVDVERNGRCHELWEAPWMMGLVYRHQAADLQKDESYVEASGTSGAEDQHGGNGPPTKRVRRVGMKAAFWGKTRKDRWGLSAVPGVDSDIEEHSRAGGADSLDIIEISSTSGSAGDDGNEDEDEEDDQEERDDGVDDSVQGGGSNGEDKFSGDGSANEKRFASSDREKRWLGGRNGVSKRKVSPASVIDVFGSEAGHGSDTPSNSGDMDGHDVMHGNSDAHEAAAGGVGNFVHANARYDAVAADRKTGRATEDGTSLSDLHYEIVQFSKYVSLTPCEIRARQTLISTVQQEATAALGPGAEARPFGSYSCAVPHRSNEHHGHEFSTFLSDVDISVRPSPVCNTVAVSPASWRKRSPASGGQSGLGTCAMASLPHVASFEEGSTGSSVTSDSNSSEGVCDDLQEGKMLGAESRHGNEDVNPLISPPHKSGSGGMSFLPSWSPPLPPANGKLTSCAQVAYESEDEPSANDHTCKGQSLGKEDTNPPQDAGTNTPEADANSSPASQLLRASAPPTQLSTSNMNASKEIVVGCCVGPTEGRKAIGELGFGDEGEPPKRPDDSARADELKAALIAAAEAAAARRTALQAAEQDGTEGRLQLHVSVALVRSRQSQRGTGVVGRRQRRESVVSGLNKLGKRLRKRRWVESFQFRPRAKVPIIAMRDARSGIDCDIGWGGYGDERDPADAPGLAFFTQGFRETFAPLAKFLKVLMYQRGLDKPYTGGIGSFKLYALIAAHLDASGVSERSRPADFGELLLGFLRRYSSSSADSLSTRTLVQFAGITVSLDSASRAWVASDVFGNAYKALTAMQRQAAVTKQLSRPSKTKRDGGKLGGDGDDGSFVQSERTLSARRCNTGTSRPHSVLGRVIWGSDLRRERESRLAAAGSRMTSPRPRGPEPQWHRQQERRSHIRYRPGRACTKISPKDKTKRTKAPTKNLKRKGDATKISRNALWEAPTEPLGTYKPPKRPSGSDF